MSMLCGLSRDGVEKEKNLFMENGAVFASTKSQRTSKKLLKVCSLQAEGYNGTILQRVEQPKVI